MIQASVGPSRHGLGLGPVMHPVLGYRVNAEPYISCSVQRYTVQGLGQRAVLCRLKNLIRGSRW